MKYYAIKIDERGREMDSPFSHFTGILAEMEINSFGKKEESVEYRIKEILNDWYGKKEKAEILGDDLFGIYQFKCGKIKLRGWTEITKEDYNVLKKYLIEL